MVPVAAGVVAVVAAGAALFVFTPEDNEAPAPVHVAGPEGPAQGEVYYSLRLTDLGAGGVLRETQVWQPQDQAGEWRQQVLQGTSIKDGRVVPGEGRVDALPGGVCYPAFKPNSGSCTSDGSWYSPTLDFLAKAPRDPGQIGQLLRAESLARTNDNGQHGADLAYLLELHMVAELLAGNGVPADLSAALQQAVAAIPGITVTKDMANLTGQRGTGYGITQQGRTVAVIFTADGHYLGSPTEAVHHGVAPGLGQPPSRMLD
jgi:hypothetical protein